MAAEALEQSVLESKDKDQLLAIAKALGLKASARTKKSDIIDQILETTGSARGANGDLTAAAVNGSANGDAPAAVDVVAPGAATTATPPAPTLDLDAPAAAVDIDEPPAEWELAVDDDTAEVDDVTAAANDGLVSTPAADTDRRVPREQSPQANGRSGERSGGGGQPQGSTQQAIGAAARRRREPQPSASPPPQGRRAGPRWPAG